MILCLAVASHQARSHRIIVTFWKPDPNRSRRPSPRSDLSLSFSPLPARRLGNTAVETVFPRGRHRRYSFIRNSFLSRRARPLPETFARERVRGENLVLEFRGFELTLPLLLGWMVTLNELDGQLRYIVFIQTLCRRKLRTFVEFFVNTIGDSSRLLYGPRNEYYILCNF